MPSADNIVNTTCIGFDFEDPLSFHGSGFIRPDLCIVKQDPYARGLTAYSRAHERFRPSLRYRQPITTGRAISSLSWS